jgi:hypothetical protein
MEKLFINQFTNSNISLETAFEEFKRYKRAKNLTDKTIAYYEDCIRYFR